VVARITRIPRTTVSSVILAVNEPPNTADDANPHTEPEPTVIAELADADVTVDVDDPIQIAYVRARGQLDDVG